MKEMSKRLSLTFSRTYFSRAPWCVVLTFVGCSGGATTGSPAGGGKEVALNNSAIGITSGAPAAPAQTVELTAALGPPAATYGAGAQLDFQLTWAETITVTGTPRLLLQVGGQNRYAEYLDNGTTPTLTFRYTVQAGDSDANGIDAVELLPNGGSLTGSPSGNPADSDFASLLASLSGVHVNTSVTPPGAPGQVSAAPTTQNTSLAISWSVPADNGTPISSYLLQYRVQGEALWTTRSPNPSSNSANLTGLTAGIPYEIRVAAHNGALGAYSAVQEAQIFDIMSFSPIAWLDGADVTGTGTNPAHGTKLATWVDKTGAAQNATEAVPANQPTFQTGVKNGLPAVYFNSHDRGLQGSFTRVHGTSLTIFVVGQFNSAVSDRCMFEFLGGASARAFFIDRRYATNTVYNPALTKNAFQLWRITNSGATAEVVENGTTPLHSGTIDFNTNFTGTGTYTLGDDSTGGNMQTGYIGEILIFDSALSAGNITQIETYLQTKWGL